MKVVFPSAFHQQEYTPLTEVPFIKIFQLVQNLVQQTLLNCLNTSYTPK